MTTLRHDTHPRWGQIRRARWGQIKWTFPATGICFDNAPSEAFFASLKKELVHRVRFATRAEAKRAIITWIEGWYNARRLHSTLGYLTPNEKEANYWHNQQQAA